MKYFLNVSGFSSPEIKRFRNNKKNSMYMIWCPANDETNEDGN